MAMATIETCPWPCQGPGHGHARDMTLAMHGHTRDMAMATSGTCHGHTRGMAMAMPGTALPEKEDPRLSHPDYVKMPFSQSAECTVPVPGKSWPYMGQKKTMWPVICKALTKSIREFNDLKNAIWSYNESDPNVWNFNGLQVFLDNHLDEGDRKEFFHHVLPEMAKLVLRLPQLCSEPIPLLRTGTAHSITMSQEQAACLLANAFFCTFPGCNTHKRSNFPGINFNRLYRGPISPKRAGKLRCLLHYFKTVTENSKSPNHCHSLDCG
ncbi:Poly(ADP-ribose) glycohydrolase [Lamellibrachia satsuma]|nr:Poly(ADP-ribose) glycohydrolase [Lamellibrachia satsuma]